MTSAMDAERDKYSMMNFEETELRLGLPGGGSSSNDGESSSSSSLIRANGGNNNNKRGFSETADGVVDLKLNLSSSNHDDLGSASVSASSVALDKAKEKSSSSSSSNSITAAATASPPRANDPAKPPAKAQVVGWPPVRSFRRNIVNVQRSNKEGAAAEKATTTTTTTAKSSGALNNAAFVKVSVDGAPYLRKVDLKLYKSYKELSDALAKMFSSFTINGNCGSQGIVDKEFMNESKTLLDLSDGSDYVPTYEDKDGDWMLVGDVPWEMFVESCKRLRIVKGSEAIGLAPRAVEKCKNRS